jgi:hypothetical protein
MLNQRHIEKLVQRYKRLGWIDFKNDTSASEAVLLRVEISTKETGMTGVHLPPNFNDLDRGGCWWTSLISYPP